MKKIYGFTLLVALCLGMASCSDDKGEATPLSTINVIAAETSFESCESTGKVVVDCNPIKAYVDAADQQWLDVQVEQNTVSLTAKRNTSSESRNALLIIKKTANDSVMLNVDQKGMIFIVQDKTDILQQNDLAGEYSYSVQAEVLPQVLSAPSWVEANFTTDKLKVKLSKNDDGHMRQGYVTYSCGNMKDSIKVTQFELEKDFLGDYELWADYDEKTGTCSTKVPVKIGTTDNGSITMNFTSVYKNTNVDFQIPMTFSEDSLAFNITSGQLVASYKNKKNKWTYFYAIFIGQDGRYLPYEDANGNLILSDTSGKISAFMKYENGKGTFGKFTGKAFDNSGNVADFGSMLFGAFSVSSPYLNYLIDNKWAFYLKDMMLVKKDK